MASTPTLAERLALSRDMQKPAAPAPTATAPVATSLIPGRAGSPTLSERMQLLGMGTDPSKPVAEYTPERAALLTERAAAKLKPVATTKTAGEQIIGGLSKKVADAFNQGAAKWEEEERLRQNIAADEERRTGASLSRMGLVPQAAMTTLLELEDMAAKGKLSTTTDKKYYEAGTSKTIHAARAAIREALDDKELDLIPEAKTLLENFLKENEKKLDAKMLRGEEELAQGSAKDAFGYHNPDAKTGSIEQELIAEYSRRRQGFTGKQILDNTAGLLPFAGGAGKTADLAQTIDAAKRLEKDPTDVGARYTIAQFLVAEEAAKKAGWGERVLDIAKEMPSFVGEFALTSGAYTGTKKAAEKILMKVLRKTVGGSVKGSIKGGLKKLTTSTLSRAAGVLAQTAANPQMVLKDTMETLLGNNLAVNADDQGKMQVAYQDNKGFMQALAEGGGRSYIEMLSERSGAALGKIAMAPVKGARKFAGAVFNRMPSAARIRLFKEGVAAKFMASKAGEFAQDAAEAYGAFNRALAKGGWHGLIGELGEERLGEVLRGVTGLGEMPRYDMEWLKQIGAEAAAFAILPLGQSAAAGVQALGAEKDKAAFDLPSRKLFDRVARRVDRGGVGPSRKELAKLYIDLPEGEQNTIENRTKAFQSFREEMGLQGGWDYELDYWRSKVEGGGSAFGAPRAIREQLEKDGLIEPRQQQEGEEEEEWQEEEEQPEEALAPLIIPEEALTPILEEEQNAKQKQGPVQDDGSGQVQPGVPQEAGDSAVGGRGVSQGGQEAEVRPPAGEGEEQGQVPLAQTILQDLEDRFGGQVAEQAYKAALAEVAGPDALAKQGITDPQAIRPPEVDEVTHRALVDAVSEMLTGELEAEGVAQAEPVAPPPTALADEDLQPLSELDERTARILYEEQNPEVPWDSLSNAEKRRLAEQLGVKAVEEPAAPVPAAPAPTAPAASTVPAPAPAVKPKGEPFRQPPKTGRKGGPPSKEGEEGKGAVIGGKKAPAPGTRFTVPGVDPMSPAGLFVNAAHRRGYTSDVDIEKAKKLGEKLEQITDKEEQAAISRNVLDKHFPVKEGAKGEGEAEGEGEAQTPSTGKKPKLLSRSQAAAMRAKLAAKAAAKAGPKDVRHEIWKRKVAKRIKAVLAVSPILKGATVDVVTDDPGDLHAFIDRPDGLTTVIHFNADRFVDAYARSKGYETAAGVYMFDNGEIYLHSKAGTGTVSHELMHWLEDMGIVTQEEVERVGNEYNERMRRSGGKVEESAREGFAKAYEVWSEGELAPSGKVNKLFVKIRKFLKDLLKVQASFWEEVHRRQAAGEVKPLVPKTGKRTGRRVAAEGKKHILEEIAEEEAAGVVKRPPRKAPEDWKWAERPPLQEQPGVVVGKKWPLHLADGTEREVVYMMADIEQVMPSHDPTKNWAPVPGADWNERPYNDSKEGLSSRLIVEDIAQAKPSKMLMFLSDTPTADNGPPITTEGGIVLGGNARTMGAKLAYHKGKEAAGRMREEMLEAAHRFGIDEEAASKIAHPIIVRVLQGDPGAPGEMSRLLNESQAAGRGAGTNAAAQGRSIQERTINLLSRFMEPDEKGETPSIREILADPKKSMELMRHLVSDGVFSKQDVQRIVTGDNRLTANGKLEIEQALVGRILPDPRVISTMEDSVRARLISAIGPITRGMGNEEHGKEIGNVVRDAIEVFSEYKASELPLRQFFFEQATLTDFPGKGDKAVAALVNGLDTLGQRQFRDTMELVLKKLGIQRSSSKGGGRSVFGEEEAKEVAAKPGEAKEAIYQVFGGSVALSLWESGESLNIEPAPKRKKTGRKDQAEGEKIVPLAGQRSFIEEQEEEVRAVTPVQIPEGKIKPKGKGRSTDDYDQSKLFQAQEQADLFSVVREDDAPPGALFSQEPSGRALQIESPAFKKWFGDSKIVDTEGKPLVVYHGTNAKDAFTVFQSKRLQSVFTLDGEEIRKANSWDMGDDYKSMPEGYHYGAVSDALSMGAEKAYKYRKKEANKYKRPDGSYSPGTTRHLADLKRMIGKKFARTEEVRPTGDSPWFTPSTGYSFIRDIGGFEHGRVMPVYLSIKNPKWVNAAEIESAGHSWRVEEMRKEGYDGAIFAPHPEDLTRNGWSGSTQIVAFDANQIKSAIGNRGTFDPSNPDISFAIYPSGETLGIATERAKKHNGKAAVAEAKKQAAELSKQYPAVNWEVMLSFPTTTNSRKAGYIRPDGELVDMSYGESTRQEDHSIAGGANGRTEIQKAGWIRYAPEGNGLQIGKRPSKGQYKTIRSLINEGPSLGFNYLLIEASNNPSVTEGGWQAPFDFNKTYKAEVHPDTVIRDLESYFDGEKRYESPFKQFLSDAAFSTEGRESEEDPFEIIDPEIGEMAEEIVNSAMDSGMGNLDEVLDSVAEEFSAVEMAALTPAIRAHWDKRHPPVREVRLDPEITSVKNDVVEGLRRLRRIGLLPKADPENAAIWMGDAQRMIEKDPTTADRLIRELHVKPRPTSDRETAVLQIHYRMLNNRLARLSKLLEDSYDAGDIATVASTQTALEVLQKELSDTEKVLDLTGTEWHKSGMARQIELLRDYTIVGLSRRGRAAVGGRPLYASEMEELTRASAKIAELEAALEEAEAEARTYRVTLEHERNKRRAEKLRREEAKKRREAEGKRTGRRPAPTPPATPATPAAPAAEKPAGKPAAKPVSKVEAAFKNMDSLFGAMATEASGKSLDIEQEEEPGGPRSSDPKVIAGCEQLAAAMIDEGAASSLPQFLKLVSDRWGEKAKAIRGTLTDAWEKVSASKSVKRSKVFEKMDPTGDSVKLARAISRQAKKLHRMAVAGGVTNRDEAVEVVHEALEKLLPGDMDWDIEQTKDAMSGYGLYTLPSEEPIDVEIARHQGELRALSKLRDLAAGERPKATGHQRRTQEEEELRLNKLVYEGKKRARFAGPHVTGTLKTAVDTMITFTERRIKEVKYELKQRERIVKERTPLVPTQRLIDLRAELRYLRSLHRKMFPKKPLTLEEKARRMIRGLDREIARLEKDMREGRIARKGPGERITNLAIERRRERITELRKQRAEMRELAEPNYEYEKWLKKRLAFLENIHKTRRFDKLRKKPKERELTPRQKQLKYQMNKELETVQKLFEAWRKKSAPKPVRMVRMIPELVNTSREIITAYDFSAVFRHGALLVAGHPILAVKAAKKMLKASWNLKDVKNISSQMKDVVAAAKSGNIWAFLKSMKNISAEEAKKMEFLYAEELRNRPLYEFGEKCGLEIVSPDGKLSRQDELYMGGYADYLYGVAASKRAYITFLNVMRAEVFDAMVRAHTKYRHGEMTEEQGKVIANFVNVFSGRGAMKFKILKQASVAMAHVFFAPRFVVSRFQALTLQPLLLGGKYKGSSTARALILIEYARTLGGIALFYGVINMLSRVWPDDDKRNKPRVEWDPRSSDFGKVRMGNTRIDPLGGLSQATVLLSRLGSGKIKKVSGEVVAIRGKNKPYGGTSASDLLGKFMWTKLSPWLGTSVNIAVGQDPVGNPVTWDSVAQSALIPMSVRDIVGAAKDQGIPKAAVLSLLAVMGMGMQTFKPYQRKERGRSSSGPPRPPRPQIPRAPGKR